MAHTNRGRVIMGGLLAGVVIINCPFCIGILLLVCGGGNCRRKRQEGIERYYSHPSDLKAPHLAPITSGSPEPDWRCHHLATRSGMTA